MKIHDSPHALSTEFFQNIRDLMQDLMAKIGDMDSKLDHIIHRLKSTFTTAYSSHANDS